MNIDGKTKVCGLIGDPVEHTLSPLIHNTLSELLGIPMVYVPFPVEGGRLEQAVRGAEALHIHGLNVTVPHKSAVLPCLAQVDELAEDIGAVNTLVSVEGGYKGYNTDMEGLYRALRSEGIDMRGEEVIILGAGGAARAVAYLCAHKGAARIYLLNRTEQKAIEVAGEVNRSLDEERIVPMAMADADRLPDARFLAIQCTSAGLYPRTEEEPVGDSSVYRRIHTGFDLIYNPAKTKFMRLVEEAGGKAYNGLRMLLYQGVIAYELWNKVTVEEKICLDVYARLRKAVRAEG